jgi:hypothetical protein
LVNTDDLEEESKSTEFMDDHNSCICPETIRPYKSKGSTWSLQKAIKYSFDQALDKSMTVNFWSCGLDPILHTWKSNEDRQTRKSLISYAINDVFAPTNLYFHLIKSSCSRETTVAPIDLNSIMSIPTANLPTFLILSDSHCKRLNSIINTPDYCVMVQSISGLQWINPYDNKLCARSLILSSSLSSRLSSASGLLFCIGTNSVRTTPALQIIEQVEEIINLIRSNHVHFNKKHDITILTTFPCYKTTTRFPTTKLLSNNIDLYNENLKLLSDRMKFSYLDLNINDYHLHNDLMHLKFEHQHIIYDTIINYFNELIIKKQTAPQSQRRSREAITRRNRKRHQKLKLKQQQYTLTRTIHPTWKLKEVKELLKLYQIQYARLPEIYKHKIRIQFNKEIYQQHAEQVLSSTAFSEENVIAWRQQHQ